MSLLDIPIPEVFKNQLPKDSRVYAIVGLVNSILKDSSLYTDTLKEDIKIISKYDPELSKLSELLDLVYFKVTRPISEGIEIPTYIHVSFGPDATRADAIEYCLNIFDDEKRKTFLKKSSPLYFNDSYLVDS